MERLDKLLAATGRLSRREVKGLVRAGLVLVDGVPAAAPEQKLDPALSQVLVDGENARLTQNEYKLVSLLGKHAGRVLTYDFIIRQLWGPGAKSDNQILRVNMANIRRKIEKNPAQPQYVFTEVGVCYRIRENENG